MQILEEIKMRRKEELESRKLALQLSNQVLYTVIRKRVLRIINSKTYNKESWQTSLSTQ